MDNRENIKIRRIEANVKGKIIEFDEYYMIDPVTGEEVFDRTLEIENDARLYDIYKKQMNLLTSSEIKNIRKKYDMNQKEFALSIGVGEITIHRFENGSIQTESVDSIIRLSEDPDIMYNLLIKNQTNLSDADFNCFLKKVSMLKRLKQHKIAKFNINDYINLNFETETVDNVTNQLIIEYNTQIDNVSKKYGIEDNCGAAEYITPLKLQKLLYYIQGIALRIYGNPAFSNNISAWQYGPVVEEIYKQYKGRNPISTPKTDYEVCDGLKKIIQLVVSSYGQIEAGTLIDLTHDEDPWIKSVNSGTISIELIKDYFNKVYE
ncbi:MAG: DUF4065 domain-containing protein [Bacilli bacterium]|nr:DUF4065 domain-containing protein [Bacilli bacterium]